jgi:hypothetical protein
MKVRRASDHGVSTTGFVIAVGRKWALLAETTDGGHPDGHIAVRLSDVAKVRWEETFQVRAEQLATTWPPEAPVPLDTLDLDSTRGVLRTLVGPAQLVSVETDRLRLDRCGVRRQSALAVALGGATRRQMAGRAVRLPLGEPDDDHGR